MPKKIGKLFSSAKSKILGATSSSPSKKSTSASSLAGTGSLNSRASTSATIDEFSITDADPILGPSTSRDSFTTAPTVEAHSRSSSFASNRGGATKSRGGSRDSRLSEAAAEVSSGGSGKGRGTADGAEEEDLNLSTAGSERGAVPLQTGEPSGLRRFFSFGPTLTSTTGYNELYTEQKDLHQSSWLSSTFQLGSSVPVLFGTWDGVFITCVVHLFGVISFLRIGWLVGNEGILAGAGIVFGCLLFTTVSLLAAIGIMERCAAATAAAGTSGLLRSSSSGGYHHHPTGSGILHPFDDNTTEYPTTVGSARANVHLLISTVLGSRIGGAISLIYCFGQAVSCALHCVGFTETFVQIIALFIERHCADPHLPPPNWLASFSRTLASLLMIDIQTTTGDKNGAPIPNLLLSQYTYQIVSASAIMVLFIFNVLGVKILFRLQTILFLSLVLAVVDFTSGLFIEHGDYGYGQIIASTAHLHSNLYPNSPTSSPQFWSHLFTVIGVFFPSSIGVMAGVNMGADLQTPTRSIPLGSLSAIATSYGIHLLFILGLGLTCSRAALLNDFSISQHVSALGFFFLTGLYMSALSSSLGSMYTAPRILQNLAQELHSFPIVRCFATGRGPNKIPINALILFTLVTLAFVMIGGINVLAPIVTIPYLLTYATIEYAYFSMAMTFDMQINREKRFMAIAAQLRADGGETPDSGTVTKVLDGTKAGSQNGSVNNRSSPPARDPTETTALTDTSSVTLLKIDDLIEGPAPPSPTPSMQHLVGYGSVQTVTAHIKIKRRQSTQSSSSDEDGLEEASGGERFLKEMKRTASGNSRARHVSGSSTTSGKGGTSKVAPPPPPPKKTKTIRQLMAAESDDDEDEDEEIDGADQEVNVPSHGELNRGSVFRFETSDLNRYKVTATPPPATTSDSYKAPLDQENEDAEAADRLLNPDPELAEIACKTEIWYLRLMNRWIVLVAALAKLTLMFFIAWHYALITLATFIGFYILIGRTNPGFYPGVSEFALGTWLKNIGQKMLRRKNYSNGSGGGANLVASYSYDRIIIPPTSIPNPNYQSQVLSRANTDYSSRQSFHGSTLIKPQFE